MIWCSQWTMVERSGKIEYCFGGLSIKVVVVNVTWGSLGIQSTSVFVGPGHW